VAQPIRPHPLPASRPSPPKLELVHDADEKADPKLSAAIEEEAELSELPQEEEGKKRKAPLPLPTPLRRPTRSSSTSGRLATVLSSRPPRSGNSPDARMKATRTLSAS